MAMTREEVLNAWAQTDPLRDPTEEEIQNWMTYGQSEEQLINEIGADFAFDRLNADVQSQAVAGQDDLQAQIDQLQSLSDQLASGIYGDTAGITSDFINFSGDISGAAIDTAAAERDALTQQILELAPYVQDIREAGEMSQTTDIRTTLADQILEELMMGSTLTDEQARDAEQAVRSAQGARGTLSGTGGATYEAVKTSLEGLELQDQRQDAASSFLGLEAASSPSAFSAIGGLPTTGTAIGFSSGYDPFNVSSNLAATSGNLASAFTSGGTNTYSVMRDLQNQANTLDFLTNIGQYSNLQDDVTSLL